MLRHIFYSSDILLHIFLLMPACLLKSDAARDSIAATSDAARDITPRNP